MLEIRGLHKIYGKYHALSGLDMTVETGALYGFVGLSLIHILCYEKNAFDQSIELYHRS